MHQRPWKKVAWAAALWTDTVTGPGHDGMAPGSWHATQPEERALSAFDAAVFRRERFSVRPGVPVYVEDGCQYAEADASHALIREGTLPICREADMLH